MAVITTERCFRPFLVALSDAPQRQINDVTVRVADLLQLSDAERQARVAGGSTTVVRHRCGWARTALSRAGLIVRVSRGIWRITDAGREALQRFPVEIREVDLREQYPTFREWVNEIADRARARRLAGSAEEEAPVAEEIDDEVFASAPERMHSLERHARALIEDAILERLSAMHWAKFEGLVERLVIKLGYGASEDEVASALRGGTDEGVDGVVNEDRLGLGQIYLQAKRWSKTVGRPAIQSFVGAMHGRAQKGVFITTSDFSREAREYAETLHGLRLRLVDGRELASLMVDCGLGVSEEQVFRTYRVDSDFFEEGE
jgi:restriction system protein